MPGGLSDASVWPWRTAINLIRTLPSGLRGIVVSDKVALRQVLAQTTACSVFGALIGIAYGVVSGVFLALLQMIIDLFQIVLSSIWLSGGSFRWLKLPKCPICSNHSWPSRLYWLGSWTSSWREERPAFGWFLSCTASHPASSSLVHGGRPWNLKQFLDHATQLTFMRRVGNGYIFAHGLLQDHFARMADEAR